MKNLINIIYKAALCLIFTLLTTYAFSQIPLCDTCKYTMELEKFPDILDSIVPDPPILNVTEYTGCPVGDTSERVVTFIHGLGGNSSSWAHQARWTDGSYKADEVEVNYGSHTQTSFHSVAGVINREIWTGTGSGTSNYNPNRCILNDFAIAHSQGGIAARYLDWEWDQSNSNFGKRSFFGLVTFGVPHAGAHVALTKNEHPSFINDVVFTVFLEDIYDLLGLAPSLDNLVKQTAQFTEQHFLPIMLADLHTNTLNEMAPNTDTINMLNNHKSRLRKVAFYGVEQAPECWKVMDNMVTKSAESYPLFKAIPDSAFQNTIEKVRAEHLAKIISNNAKYKKIRNTAGLSHPKYVVLSGGTDRAMQRLKTENKYRQEAVTFLNNANTQWRYLIGSYHRDSVETQLVKKYKVSWEVKYGFLGKWYDGERVFYSETEADQFMKIYPSDKYKVKDMKKEECLEYRTGKKFFPSDGVVLVKSQIAFPGVGNRVDKLEGDNHFQMRNSPETERVLKRLYYGGTDGYDDYFKTLEK